MRLALARSLPLLALVGLSAALSGCKGAPAPELASESSTSAATGTSGMNPPTETSGATSSETDTGDPGTEESTQEPPDESSSESSESGETSSDAETSTAGESESGSETGEDETETGETGEPAEPCSDLCGTPDCGICPPTAMSDGAGYRIDQTELPVEHYAEFLAVELAEDFLLPECSWKPDFGGFEPEFWIDQEAGDPERPVTGVDWCDAETYCRWAGKHLCGTIGGGAPNFDELETPSDEWYQACSGGGDAVYPYGDDYEALACNGWELGVEDVVPVGTLPACEGGLEGVHDLSGNVWEWTAACAEPNPDLQDHELECRRRGGSWYTTEANLLRCGVKSKRYRAFRSSNVGIRCCAAP